MKQILIIGGAVAMAMGAGCALDTEEGDFGVVGQAETQPEREDFIDAKYYSDDDISDTLGSPITDYVPTSSPPGAYRKYAGGMIAYGDQVNRAHIVWGAIQTKYLAKGGPGGVMGYPRSDELDGYANAGKVNTFQNGGVLFKWGAPEAYAVQGSIYFDLYWDLGSEWSNLGWPKSDELAYSYSGHSQRRSNFERGSIFWESGEEPWPVFKVVPPSNPALDAFGAPKITYVYVTTSGCLRVTGTRFTPGSALSVALSFTRGREYFTGTPSTVPASGSFTWSETPWQVGERCDSDGNALGVGTTTTVLAKDAAGKIAATAFSAPINWLRTTAYPGM